MRIFVFLLSLFFSHVALAQDLPAPSSGKRWRALYFETSSNTARDMRTGDWKSQVPYKQNVRFVTDFFEFKEEWDPVRELDLTIQFYEHLFKKYPKELEKMKYHGYSEPPQRLEIYKTNPQSGYSSHRALLTNKPDQWQWDIIHVTDFKYVDGKNPNPRGNHPTILKMWELRSGGEKKK